MHFSFHHYLTLYSSACFAMHKPWNLCLRCITVHNCISWCTRHGPNPLPTWYGPPTRDKYTSTTTNYSIATASISTTNTSSTNTMTTTTSTTATATTTTDATTATITTTTTAAAPAPAAAATTTTTTTTTTNGTATGCTSLVVFPSLLWLACPFSYIVDHAFHCAVFKVFPWRGFGRPFPNTQPG